MKLSKLADDFYAIEASHHDLTIIASAIELVVEEIEEWEFQTRTGSSPHEANQVLASIRERLTEKMQGQIKFASSSRRLA